MGFVKNLRLFPCFILMQNRAIKKMSFNVLKQKEADFKKGLKLAFFSKGLEHGFCRKIKTFFKIFVWFKLNEKKVFGEVPERMEVFLD